MQQDNTGRVPNAGPDTGPLSPDSTSQGAPTTYVPPQPAPGGQTYALPQNSDAQRAPSGFGQHYAPARPGVNPPPLQQPYNRSGVPGRMHRERHRIPFLGPLLLIIIGSIFLLNNLNILDWSVWESLSRLWPLVLIAVGIDILFGRRRPVLSLLIVLAVFSLGAGYLYSSGALRGSGRVLTTPMIEPIGDVKSADVTVNMGTGDLSVSGTDAGETNLARGSLQYREGGAPPLTLSSRKDGTDYLRIEQRGNNFSFMPFFSKSSPSWDLHLNPALPLSLDVETGAGRVTLDLSRLKLGRFQLNAGAGDALVAFPISGVISNASINTGAGNLSIIVPQSLQAHIKIAHGFGNVSADERFSSSGKELYVTRGYTGSGNHLDLTVNAGVGNIDIRPARPQP